jgi:hypothetical protein
MCLCCGLDSEPEVGKAWDDRQSLSRHHFECPERILTVDSDEVQELKKKLLDACDMFNTQHFRAVEAEHHRDLARAKVQGIQTFYASINTPECPFCDSETVFLAEAFAKENLHYYRCRECRRQFSRPPLVS